MSVIRIRILVPELTSPRVKLCLDLQIFSICSFFHLNRPLRSILKDANKDIFATEIPNKFNVTIGPVEKIFELFSTGFVSTLQKCRKKSIFNFKLKKIKFVKYIKHSIGSLLYPWLSQAENFSFESV